MNVVLVHPIYGAKVAICEEEVLVDEKQGWKRHTSVEVDHAEVVKSQKPARGRPSKERAEVAEKLPDFLSQGGNTIEVE